jgi:acyl-CoA thioesterase YciA
MRIHVDSWARSRFDAESNEVTNAEFVFVALDDDGKPRQINYHEDTAILS